MIEGWDEVSSSNSLNSSSRKYCRQHGQSRFCGCQGDIHDIMQSTWKACLQLGFGDHTTVSPHLYGRIHITHSPDISLLLATTASSFVVLSLRLHLQQVELSSLLIATGSPGFGILQHSSSPFFVLINCFSAVSDPCLTVSSIESSCRSSPMKSKLSEVSLKQHKSFTNKEYFPGNLQLCIFPNISLEQA